MYDKPLLIAAQEGTASVIPISMRKLSMLKTYENISFSGASGSYQLDVNCSQSLCPLSQREQTLRSHFQRVLMAPERSAEVQAQYTAGLQDIGRRAGPAPTRTHCPGLGALCPPPSLCSARPSAGGSPSLPWGKAF